MRGRHDRQSHRKHTAKGTPVRAVDSVALLCQLGHQCDSVAAPGLAADQGRLCGVGQAVQM